MAQKTKNRRSLKNVTRKRGIKVLLGGKTVFENVQEAAAKAAVVVADAAEKAIDSYVTVPPFFYKSVRYVKVYNKVDKELNKQINLSHKEMPKLGDIWSIKVNGQYNALQKKNPYRYKITKDNIKHLDEIVQFLFEKKLNILLFNPESYNIFINLYNYFDGSKTPNEQLAKKIVILKLMKMKKIVFISTRTIEGIFETKLKEAAISKKYRS